ncbi:hypothetical protein C7Y47_24065 [Lysinibacillus sphaericus]|uniref:YozE SAM-like domain-containing protein n=1 Tax=Lysinibacillus sphaericus TaxID=1421 RepID=A0A544U7D2_LYSSH|nr:YozE family protein [Lysinibacillus sp. SDF0037]TQR26865.1 hypothetical protein C7Y47_24065 [Lysinibacillus sp. SDF0037]
MTFKQWLKQYVNDDSPIGDLARDNELDPYFPNTNSYNKMYDYLLSQNASYLCLQSFEKAWHLYKNGGIKMSFKNWLVNSSDYSKYGWLTVDIENDKTFPNTNNYFEMFNYLVKNNAGEMSKRLFKEAWEEYNN